MALICRPGRRGCSSSSSSPLSGRTAAATAATTFHRTGLRRWVCIGTTIRATLRPRPPHPACPPNAIHRQRMEEEGSTVQRSGRSSPASMAGGCSFSKVSLFFQRLPASIEFYFLGRILFYNPTFSSSFLSDGKFILELASSRENDNGRPGWVAVPRKIYWPPTAQGFTTTYNAPSASTASSSSATIPSAVTLCTNTNSNHSFQKNESSASLSCKWSSLV